MTDGRTIGDARKAQAEREGELSGVEACDHKFEARSTMGDPYESCDSCGAIRDLPLVGGLTEAELGALRVAVDKDEDCSCHEDNDTSHLVAAVERILADRLAARSAESAPQDGTRADEARIADAADEAARLESEYAQHTLADAHLLGWREAIDALGWVLANGPDWGPSQAVSDAMVYVAAHPTDPYDRAKATPLASPAQVEAARHEAWERGSRERGAFEIIRGTGNFHMVNPYERGLS